ncbi:hypothetical protein C490_07626 [Natronobacterium gregoryi SP2]|uniref:Uncharacterized protein n=1 Tax=Natronobacterium gregoryi (strain ATCC 43098 / DSM 3393 / CCM 3738 / CIP 104747 / IAM 13177 / JCM 8860 / NBRC 102187 / NCIMB 2189 / SP2) TaxID=797304 RepID=L9Y7M6_NATGS|nr:hypothetical protein C490_07626 [Natronobacterium gregoryi SP2]
MALGEGAGELLEELTGYAEAIEAGNLDVTVGAKRQRGQLETERVGGSRRTDERGTGNRRKRRVAVGSC